MTSKIKALGIALAATFALSAVAAPAAMAQTNPAHFFSHAANGKTHIHGQQVGENNVFTLTDEEGEPTSEFRCPNEGTTFTGTPSDTEGNTEQANTFTDVEVHPTYANHEKLCPVKLGGTNFGKAQVHTEGCNFVLSAHTDANGHAPVHILCEPGKEITITAALGCVIHIPPQTPEGGVHYEVPHGGSTESGEEAVLVKATVTGIQFTATSPCPTGVSADYESEITVKGYEDRSEEEEVTTGPQVSVTWTETAE